MSLCLFMLFLSFYVFLSFFMVSPFFCSVSHINMSLLSLCLFIYFFLFFYIFMSFRVFLCIFYGFSLFLLSFPHQYVFPLFVQFSLLGRMRDKVSVEICLMTDRARALLFTKITKPAKILFTKNIKKPAKIMQNMDFSALS